MQCSRRKRGSRRGPLALQPLVDAQHDVDGLVAVRVDADLPVGGVDRAQLLVELGFRRDQDAAVVGPAHVGVAQPRGALRDGPVADSLHEAHAHPLVAQAGAHAGLDQLAHVLPADRAIDAQPQVARLAGVLIGLQVSGEPKASWAEVRPARVIIFEMRRTPSRRSSRVRVDGMRRSSGSRAVSAIRPVSCRWRNRGRTGPPADPGWPRRCRRARAPAGSRRPCGRHGAPRRRGGLGKRRRGRRRLRGRPSAVFVSSYLKPRTQSPGLVLAARSRSAATIASIERRSQSTCFRCRLPEDATWAWPSMKPGTTVRPPRSIFFVRAADEVQDVGVAAHGQEAPARDGHGARPRLGVVHRDDVAVPEDELRLGAERGQQGERRGAAQELTARLLVHEVSYFGGVIVSSVVTPKRRGFE